MAGGSIYVESHSFLQKTFIIVADFWEKTRLLAGKSIFCQKSYYMNVLNLIR